MGLVALWHGSSSWIRDQTHVFRISRWILYYYGSDGKAEDLGSIPGSGRFPGEWNGNPLQYSCPENPMDGGAWCRLLSMGFAKSRTWLSNFTFFTTEPSGKPYRKISWKLHTHSPLPKLLLTTIILFVSNNLNTPGISCKWSHAVCVPLMTGLSHLA